MGVVNVRLADSEFLIIFGMKRMSLQRILSSFPLRCGGVCQGAVDGNVCVFLCAWKVPETSSGLGQRGGGNSSGGLEQTL